MKKNKGQTSYDVIIVNYNGEKIISGCLSSLYSCTILPSKVIIYDNNSQDNSVRIIKKKFPQVILLEGKKNLGFGRANNESMKYSSAEFILFMNNDLVLDKNCPKVLLKAFRDPGLAILNPLIFKGWGKKEDSEIYSFGAEMNKSGFGYSLYDTGSDRTDLSCFSGACFMARGKIIKKLQFEQSFFLYYEEPDLSTKILINGYKIGRVKEAKCYHLESYSSPQEDTDGIAFRQFYGIQNRWFMIGKHWPIRLLPATLTLNIVHLFYVLYFYVKNRKFCYMKLAYLAPINLIKGWCIRNSKDTRDKFWYKRLKTTSLSMYLKLGKKVFVKPTSEF